MSKRCICYEHTTARGCFELRYYGYTPAQDRNTYGDDCECGCHYEEDNDELLPVEPEQPWYPDDCNDPHCSACTAERMTGRL